jgi:hypothetical protein
MRNLPADCYERCMEKYLKTTNRKKKKKKRKKRAGPASEGIIKI